MTLSLNHEAGGDARMELGVIGGDPAPKLYRQCVDLNLCGFVSGHYSYDECHIDLARLASFAQGRLIKGEATRIDTQNSQVLLPGRPPIKYDVLSINVGITPAASKVKGALEHATAVKPIDQFVTKVDSLIKRYRERISAGGRPRISGGGRPRVSIVIVGGGAGGVEVTLSLLNRLEKEREKMGQDKTCAARFTLVTGSRGLLSDSSSFARKALARILNERGVNVIQEVRVAEVQEKLAVLKSGLRVPFDECLWCTGADGAASWLKASGLPTDPQGFISIDERLMVEETHSKSSSQDKEDPSRLIRGAVFAVGDVASCSQHPRPKAGVYAVRQGPPLVRNLRAILTGQPLERYVPQSTNLSLITSGDQYCVGTKGWLSLEGAWLWHVKDRIDRGFMHKYGDGLEEMRRKMTNSPLNWPWGQKGQRALVEANGAYSAAGGEGAVVAAEAMMRCGGCGSKVGSGILTRALKRLHEIRFSSEEKRSRLLEAAAQSGVDLDAPLDDAAVVRPPPTGHLMLHTVDFFRSFWDDGLVFGRIAANHALGDVYAMGGSPRTALALAVVPFASDDKMEEDIFQMMAGATEVLDAAGCILTGGHTTEGSEAAVGFTIYGDVKEGKVWRKGGLKPGQALVLTKGLGTGTLMASHMRGAAKGSWILNAIESMQQSNGPAVEILRNHGCTAATDVTGFGLLGHLVEMAEPSKVLVEIDMSSVPFLKGARECVTEHLERDEPSLTNQREGGAALSSLHRQNSRVATRLAGFQDAFSDDESRALWPLLVDPQTAGGLLAGVDYELADDCIKELKRAGFTQAAIIGRVGGEPARSDGLISFICR